MARRMPRIFVILLGGLGIFLLLFFTSQIFYAISCDRMSRQALKEFKEKFPSFNPDGKGNPPLYPILMTAYGHPEYLKQSLDALARVSNVENVIFLIFFRLLFSSLRSFLSFLSFL